MTRRSTAWKASQYRRTYRGLRIVVAHDPLAVSKARRWWWFLPKTEGVAPSMLAAQRAAERAVDAALARAEGAS